MAPKTLLHEDLMFSPEPAQRALARRFYRAVRDLPIVSPHGHTDPKWFALNKPFPDPATLFIIPDHYVFRMLYSRGVPLESLGIPRTDGGPVETDPKKIWRLFARYFYLFRATPTRLWFLHSLQEVFGITECFSPETADDIYDRIAQSLATPDYLPRTLFEKFNIEVLATTDSPLDPLSHHRSLRESGWTGRIIPTYRPDPVVDPEFSGFAENVQKLGGITGENTTTWRGYLRALENRRGYFKELGATATDHGHPNARTCDSPEPRCQVLLDKALSGKASPDEADEFRGRMLTEMARMSIDDGMVMQIHPGSLRNHNPWLFGGFGSDKGADIPMPTDYVRGMKPLLDRFGNDPHLSVILFTLDESTYSRELAPLAGHYPALRLGPAWWFYDSPEGMWFYRERVTGTAGFYNTVGFNDDTRAFLSIPARHDISRRADCAYLARLVAEHRLEEAEAIETAIDLAYRLPKNAYKIEKPDGTSLDESR